MSDPLLIKAVHGDAASITKLVKQYTPLVHKIVQKYAWMSPSHSRDDLVQEGLLGIVKAIETFDLERGVCFMTWVYPQIRGAVTRVARLEIKEPRWKVPIDSSDVSLDICDPVRFELVDPGLSELIKQVIVKCCGSIESKQAQIVCSRFGLLGETPLRQKDVAKKFGLTKQAVNSHISRFSKAVRKRYPELEDLI
jgi:RNA polymerase sporulation-specific sigma factor